MLANPVLVMVHLYADPIVWLVAAVSLMGELGVARSLLRRRGQPQEVGRVLFGINLLSWPTFLFLLDRWGETGDLGWPVLWLELGVVGVEAAVLWAALRSRLVARWLRTLPIGPGTALFVSLVGNAVSFAISVAVPALVWLLGHMYR